MQRPLLQGTGIIGRYSRYRSKSQKKSSYSVFATSLRLCVKPLFHAKTQRRKEAQGRKEKQPPWHSYFDFLILTFDFLSYFDNGCTDQ